MFWFGINRSCSHLVLCEVFMELAFLMWFRSAWSAWDVPAICIVSAVSDVIFPAVPSTLTFSTALAFDHHEEEVSSLCNTADTSLRVRRLSVLWIACLTLSFVYCLAKPGLSLLPKGDSWVVPSWGSTQSSYIAVKPWGFWLVIFKQSDPFLPRPW